MTERPILFSAPMVRALLSGTKTQTRRIVKSREDYGLNGLLRVQGGAATFDAVDDNRDFVETVRCPYGKPGDRLWVRETWQADPPIDDSWASTQWHGCKDAAISEIPERFRHARFALHRADWLHGDIRWRPSIFMPRWASRITLEVTGVRVERLQAISDADLECEGLQEVIDAGVDHDGYPRDAWRALWSSINGADSWEANPWVWCISFRSLAPTQCANGGTACTRT